MLILPVFGFAEEAFDESVEDVFAPVIQEAPVSNTQTYIAPTATAQLEGIGLGVEKSFAVINGLIYYEGEEKQGIKVTQIHKREVDILINGAPEKIGMIQREAESKSNLPGSQVPGNSLTGPNQGRIDPVFLQGNEPNYSLPTALKKEHS